MEADGIVEGFMNSINMHGLKFNKLISDGESSVTKRLNETLPYGNDFTITKIECRNHLLRNFATKLTALTKNIKYPIVIRNFIKSKILHFRSDITKAISYQKRRDLPINLKISALKQDIANSPYHRLGQHSGCANYFCRGSKNGEPNLVTDAEKSGLMGEIRNIVYRLSNNAESLIEDVDNNPCEQLNSLINQHIGGKRINFTQSHNYKTRIEAAVVAFNSKNYLRTLQKKITTKTPGIKRPKTKFSSSAADNNYGLAEPLIDVIVHNMLYKSSITSKEMTHGIENESLARTRFQDLTGMTVKLCGLFTDNEYPYLAASPDGLIDDNTIVEIKCPYTARDINSAKEAIENKLLQYCIVNKEGNIKLKKEHPYFYQIIGQLRITGRNICFFCSSYEKLDTY
ncbi:unnamed protein product [Macrosiphum euphorbiae]|uniref:YqaJ viral recombinase domain-containing protein n=1 Tax=Macrosiphum euphorbiae TaxID=13131 RepID=A0AAV0Y3L8_9HEMI|nr:unnamed protein product [Macrosiphum euphorbiae]